MSFKYSGVHDTRLEYEVITAKGEVLICAPDNENNHLFQMVHGTFCTLGIIFRLTFRLIAGQAHLWQIHELNQDAETVQCPSLVHPAG